MNAKPGWRSIKHGGVTDPGSSREFKTGDWRATFPIHLKEKCTNCLICTVYCPDDCILVKEGKIEKVDYDYCKGCGICFQVCPVNAIKIEDETKFEDFQKNPKKYLSEPDVKGGKKDAKKGAKKSDDKDNSKAKDDSKDKDYNENAEKSD